jgi:hypothetical protein
MTILNKIMTILNEIMAKLNEIMNNGNGDNGYPHPSSLV